LLTSIEKIEYNPLHSLVFLHIAITLVDKGSQLIYQQKILNKY